MEEKCFCHFNGYAVKDAVARENMPKDLMVNDQGGLAVGKNAGAKNEGEANTFVGYYAGGENTTGQRNTAVGNFSMFNNKKGKYNTAVGYCTETCVNSDYNTAVGYAAMEYCAEGEANTAIGAHAQSKSTGSGNTSVGYFTLYTQEAAENNTAVGCDAGRENVSGSNNTFVGSGADAPTNGSASEGVAVGANAKISGERPIAIGATAGALGERAISIGSIQAGERETVIGHALTNATKIQGVWQIPVALMDDSWVPVQDGYCSIFISRQDGKLKMKDSTGAIWTIGVS